MKVLFSANAVTCHSKAQSIASLSEISFEPPFASSTSMYRNACLLFLALLLLACGTASPDPDVTQDNQGTNQTDENGEEVNQNVPPEPVSLRVATYNTSMYRANPGQLLEDLADPSVQQIRGIAAVIQVNRPDVLFVNEFDYDEEGQALDLFRENFLEVGQLGEEPIFYPYAYAVPSNTGIPSGVDLNNDGIVDGEIGTEEYAQNAFGFGTHPGQYASAIFSKYPLDIENARFLQEFLWKDMPDNRIPRDYYSDEALDVLRLSSKNHVDMPILVGGHVLHLIGAHPTPPAFDGPEQRNVRRNHDEVRLIHDYIRPTHSGYIYDQDGVTGGLPEGARFVIVGDLNADPFDGGSSEAIAALLGDTILSDPLPESEGGEFFGERRGGANDQHQGAHKHDTALFSPAVGNLRVDYAIPSANLEVHGSAVFWPTPTQTHGNLVTFTDHRLVWVDITIE